MEGRICIFAKPPIAGQVKTRLARAIGDEAAARLAQAFLLDTIAAVRRLGWARVAVATTGPLDLPALAGLELWPQRDGDLGARLERVLSRALEDADFAITLGSDAPGLPAKLIEAARTALARTEAALGPADDGGFYLLGLRRCPPGLLADLPWSTPDTLDRTMSRLRERGLAPTLLEPWFDVDRLEDLGRLESLLDRGQLDAPATRRALESMASKGTA